MTKKVRVENADNSSYKVHAFYEDKINGQWVRVVGETKELNWPADLSDFYIHSTRRLVVEETAD